MIDYTSPIGQVRLLTSDVNEAALLVTDSQINGFLALGGNAVRLAAAAMLETIAASELLISKKIRTQDLATDAPALSVELRQLARTMRAQHRAETAGEGDIFEIVDIMAGQYL